MDISKLYGGATDLVKRNSKNTWIPTTNWIGSFCLSYVMRANRENFLYDIEGFDGENMQYTQYGEGEFYQWHTDGGLGNTFKPGCTPETLANDFVQANSEKVRKLSFTLQLSGSDEYGGGELQFQDDNGNSYFAPKKKGTIIIFDSRALHRVKKVTWGVRRSIVGWTMGPRWK
jgi:PKHD-type hydroxylase